MGEEKITCKLVEKILVVVVEESLTSTNHLLPQTHTHTHALRDAVKALALTGRKEG